MNKTLFESELNKIISLSKEYGAQKVLLFGSCLEDVESAQDIDIAVSGVRPERFFELYGKILGEIDTEIDLIPLEQVRERFSKSILETGKLLYEKKI